jgi:hypothetical protein
MKVNKKKKDNIADLLLEKALAAALLADVGLHDEVSHIVSKLDGDDVQDDPALAVRFEALLAWIGGITKKELFF